jgi:hypothetical protein
MLCHLAYVFILLGCVPVELAAISSSTSSNRLGSSNVSLAALA